MRHKVCFYEFMCGRFSNKKSRKRGKMREGERGREREREGGREEKIKK